MQYFVTHSILQPGPAARCRAEPTLAAATLQGHLRSWWRALTTSRAWCQGPGEWSPPPLPAASRSWEGWCTSCRWPRRLPRERTRLQCCGGKLQSVMSHINTRSLLQLTEFFIIIVILDAQSTSGILESLSSVKVWGWFWLSCSEILFSWTMNTMNTMNTSLALKKINQPQEVKNKTK